LTFRIDKSQQLVDITIGVPNQKTVFYTALYHLLIHPNILQDVNGEYPAMESDKITILHVRQHESARNSFPIVHGLNSVGHSLC